MHDYDYTNTLLRTDYVPAEEDFLNLRKVRLSHEEALLNSKKKLYKIKIKSDHSYMRFAGELRGDKDFIFDVIYDDYWGSTDVRPLEFVSEEIKSDKEFMLRIIERDPFALEYASDNLKADKDMILAATDFNYFRLEFASDDLKDDKDIALAAIKNCSSNYEHVSNRLKKDKKLAWAAVRLGGWNLEHTSQELQNDHQVVLTAVVNQGAALQYASNELKKNNEIVSCAIKNDAYAIEFVNHDIEIYRDMALLVVQQDGCYLPELKPSMMDDAEIVCVAMRSCEKAKFYASPRVQNAINLMQPNVSELRCSCPSEIGDD
jgi:hypothetical protein